MASMRHTQLVILPVFFLVVTALPASAQRSDAWCHSQATLIETLERLPGAPPAVGRLLERVGRTYTDACLSLNHLQVVGSHNSYHVRPRPAVLNLLLAFDPMFMAWEYDHRPLGEQFGELGVRQIELDVFADPLGGLYSFRAGLILTQDSPLSPDPEMYLPGAKVLHVQDLDFESRCITFVKCLLDIKAWSDGNPGHLPITVLVELKDEAIPDPINLGFVTPIPFGANEMASLEAEILSVLPRERILMPDDVRRAPLTLEESVLQHGWPRLGATRGKILFAMDNGGDKRTTYIAGAPNLEGRVLFTNGVPGQADAAFVKRNDPIGSFTDIQGLVADGYIVRTRADADTVQARTGDGTQRDAALASGAQFVSTDYAEPDPVFGTGYRVELPEGPPARCNPVVGPAGCRVRFIEP